MKLDRRTSDYEACFTNVTLRNEDEIDADLCKPCICNLLKRYDVMVEDHPVINDLFCMKGMQNSFIMMKMFQPLYYPAVHDIIIVIDEISFSFLICRIKSRHP